MNRDDVIRVAREAGISDTAFDFQMVSPEDLERFAALVAAAEREAYAKETKKLFVQPAPSVPEDVMRDAERYRYLRARDDDTAGVGCWIEADGRACDRGWLYGVQLDSAIDSFIEVLAAAPKPEGE